MSADEIIGYVAAAIGIAVVILDVLVWRVG